MFTSLSRFQCPRAQPNRTTSCLAITVEHFKMDTRHVSEARIKDRASVITIRSPDIASFSRFTLSTSSGPILSVLGHADVRIAQRVRAEVYCYAELQSTVVRLNGFA